MERQVAGAAVVVCSAAAALFGAGVSQAGSAPNVVGQKYGDASSAISGAGLRAVVSAFVGDQKAWSDCLIANQVQRTVPPPPNSAGAPTNEVLVSLNCYATQASATTPGYSAASPEGKAITAAAKSAATSG